jgi:hypothetical protein
MAAKKNDDAKNPVAYTAPHDVYLDGKYTRAGEVFVTAADKEDAWTKRDPDEVSAIQASTMPVPPDPPLENLPIESLLAIATQKHVVTTGIEKDKDALITAIKAAQEPAL